jgi:hypothetical protein
MITSSISTLSLLGLLELVAPAEAMGLLVGDGRGVPRFSAVRVLVAEDDKGTVVATQALITGARTFLWIIPLEVEPSQLHTLMKPIQLDRLLLTGSQRYQPDARFTSDAGCSPLGCAGGTSVESSSDTGAAAVEEGDLPPWSGGGFGGTTPPYSGRSASPGLPIYRFWEMPDERPNTVQSMRTVPAVEFDKWLTDAEGEGFEFSEEARAALIEHAGVGRPLLVSSIEDTSSRNSIPTDVVPFLMPGRDVRLPFAISALSAQDAFTIELVATGEVAMAPAGGAWAPMPRVEGWDVVTPDRAFPAADARLSRFSDGHPGELALLYAAPLGWAHDEYPLLLKAFAEAGQAAQDGEGCGGGTSTDTSQPVDVIWLADAVAELAETVWDVLVETADAVLAGDENKTMEQVLRKLESDGFLSPDYVYDSRPITIFAAQLSPTSARDITLTADEGVEPWVSTVGFSDTGAPPSWMGFLPLVGLVGWGLRRRRG